MAFFTEKKIVFRVESSALLHEMLSNKAKTAVLQGVLYTVFFSFLLYVLQLATQH